MTINKIAKVVSQQFNISTEDLVNRSRRREIVEPRQIMHYLASKHTNKPLHKIGNYKKGGFTHATVINSKTKIMNYCEFDKSFKRLIDDLELLITK